MAMNENRAGLVPVETVERYEITTAEVCEWMQKRINAFIAKARNNGADIEDIPINVVTVGYSKKFAPMLIMLPEEAIAKRSKKNGNNGGIMSIFQNRGEGDVRLIEPVWSAICSFVFTPDDKKFFVGNSRMKKYMDITSRDGNRIAALCSPRIFNVSKDDRRVACLIDPIRIFSERVGKQDRSDRNSDGTPRYKVVIDGFVKLNGDNYKYTLLKKPNKKKNKSYDEIDISKIIRESTFSKN